MIEQFKWYFRHGSKKTKFTWREWHHMYIGFILLMLAFVAIFEMWPIWVFMTLLIFGLWNIADDLIQHLCQRVQMELVGYYTVRSFLHWVFYPKQWKNKL